MNSSPETGAPAPGGDPWAAFGYLVAGVGVYGFAGWGLSIWLHADYWIPIGILVGAAFGMYLVFARYRLPEPDAHNRSSSENDDDDAAHVERPDRNDRGETA
jgi:hypothetical protein